jgi:hypothetical protein
MNQSITTASSKQQDRVVAVMQPYLFPYLGYFQLISASDVFVLYDDVDFIKQGWINRNKILINNSPHVFTVPCHNASSNEIINDVAIHEGWRKAKLLKKIRMTYSNAPCFDDAFPVVERVISTDENLISRLAERSVRQVSDYLGLDVDFHRSSDLDVDPSLGRADRLIALTKHFGASTYVNMEGGTELYEKSYFSAQGVDLRFLTPHLPKYSQYTGDSFHSGLSIIDVMMNVEPGDIQAMLDEHELS